MSTPDLPPVVGLHGIDHVGLTVPDMGQALDFFTTVLGARVLHELGPVRAEDNWMAVNLGVEADAVIPRIVMLRVGAGGPSIELFEYEHPEAERHPPPQSAVGGQHTAFHVADIDAGVESLRAHGLITLGEPKRVADGPSGEHAWVRFLAPWGQQFELVAYPLADGAAPGTAPVAGAPGRGIDPTDAAPATEEDTELDAAPEAERRRDTDADPA